jgi:hypothetical protein
MELLQLLVGHIEEVARPVLEEVAKIKLMLVCVTGSLEHAYGESTEQERKNSNSFY